MNLATARSMKRAKEVGLRKVVGAGRGQMIGQFLAESILSAVIAFLIAIGLVEAALPFFNSLAGANLSLSIAQNTSVFFGLLGLVLLVGLVAGSYPAFYLSSLKPVIVLKGELKAGTRRSHLRQGLVVAQFFGDDQLVGVVVTDFLVLQGLRNHADHFAAVLVYRSRHCAHQADAPPAVDQRVIFLRQQSAKFRGRGEIRRRQGLAR
jgi:putative ABC transport system permease protein